MKVSPRAKTRKPMTEAGPPVRGRVFIRVERCKGCEFCIEFCPQKVLRLSTEFNPKGFHYPVVVKDECINCTLCVSLCPDYAIYSKPVPARPAVPDASAPSNGDGKTETLSRGSKR